ncbi:stage III sporulation protein AF [Intestinibacter sp.]|uniref:stage III sporulation protein AF n=1 Tax=Intestinibacter sp. TaxID=1965304 RepID=UPI003F13FF13
MEIIKSWIICVLIGAFIVNIVDMILPKSKLKPYINLVCNFIFVFIVISPIAGFFSEKNSLEDKILKSMTEYNEKYIESNAEILQESEIIDLNKEYENNLKSVIQLKLDEYGYELEDIDLNGTDIESLKLKEKTDQDAGSNQNDEKEVFENKTEKDLDERKLKDDLIKILEVSIDKIEID